MWLALALLISAPSHAGEWRDYQIYQPTIQRHFVVNAQASHLKYNHDSAIAWFGDRWFCLWNANEVAAEGKPGQLNYVSTSPDGREWSPPRAVFSSEESSVNPVPCTEGTQWQPNLIVVGGKLWAIWSQNSRDEHNGCYLSVLAAPDDRWTNRLITFDGAPEPVIDGKSFRVFPTQNPYQLRSGRVLAPATIIGPAAADAPGSVTGWWATEKRNAVIYTDDGGETWRCSPGAIQPGRSWAQWEPTVWELPDGTVAMFARNNDFRSFQEGGPRPAEMLLWSTSADGGESWSPHEYVPLQTVASRMHVLPAGGDRFMMVHNDWPADQFVSDRLNLALFFTRGAGLDFVAGPGLTDREPMVCYPQMWVHEGRLLVSYSQGRTVRSIKVIEVSPLPDPGTRYLLPRANLPAPAAPELEGRALTFDTGQHLATQVAPPVPSSGFSAGAFVRTSSGGTIWDNRQGKPAGGFVWGLSAQQDGIAPFVHLATKDHNIFSSLHAPPDQWAYFAVTVDNQANTIDFYVEDEREQVAFAGPAPNPLAGDTGHIGHKRLSYSRLSGLQGALAGFALYPGLLVGDQHRDLRERLSYEGPPTLPADPSALVWLRPNGGAEALADFLLPETDEAFIRVEELDGEPVLRIHHGASAGIDLDENERVDGHSVQVRFRFRIERRGDVVLFTVGDADQPAYLVCRGDELVLEAGDQSVPVGQAVADWNRVELATQGDFTEARCSGGEPVRVRHKPRATWAYLGHGYPDSRQSTGEFLVDVASVSTRVD